MVVGSSLDIMAKHFISVCIFCFLCATHSPCESHVETNHGGTSNHKSNIPFAEADAPPALQSDHDNPENTATVTPEGVLGPNLSAHNFLSNTDKHAEYNNSRNKLNRFKRNTGEVIRIENSTNSASANNSNNSDKEHEGGYLKKIFAKYGDGEVMTMEGFEKLLKHLDLNSQVLHSKLDPVLSLNNLAALISHETENTTDSNFKCLNREELVATVIASKNVSNPTLSNTIDDKALEKACPAILYNLLAGSCSQEQQPPDLDVKEPAEPPANIQVSVWLYSILAVVIISACGVLGLAVIPVMQKRYYQPLLQFLVALAVGTLAGDAFLHLLPHAMSTGHEHSRSEHGQEAIHDENMWKGFVAMLGLVLFFVVERIIVIVAKWRKERQLKHKVPKMKVMKEGVQPSSTGEKQCKHKYSSIPYCYDAIAMIDKNHKKEDYPVFRLLGGQDGVQSHNDSATTTFFDLDSSERQPFKKSNSCNKMETNQNMTECPSELNASNCTEVNKMLASENEKDDINSVEYTVILREHENRHHGHSHTHGHVHAAPKNMSSVAWMVIMGDGLHNFTDGMAIGAAFSGSIAGGFSTAVAVFCHELPHELGDFAMLLKAGMSMKQALFYNILSSVLCLLGNAFGVWLGNIEFASSWVFAVAAGTFVYIALVDMIPELSNGHEDDGTLFQCLLQLSGLLVGFGIMTFIAIYEHDLKHMFNEPL